MRIKLFLSVLLIFSLTGCRTEDSGAKLGHIMESVNADNSYTVVYVNKEGVSEEAARQALLKRAAEVAVNQGYRYFIIDSEAHVKVSFSGGGLPADEGYFPDNLYEEMIIQKDFDRNSRNARSRAPAELYPGYQVVFHFSEEYSAGKTLDACKFVPCNK